MAQKNDFIREIEIACGVDPSRVSQTHFATFAPMVDRDRNVKMQAIRIPGPPPAVFVGLVCDSRDGSAFASVEHYRDLIKRNRASIEIETLNQDVHGRVGRSFATQGVDPASLAREAKAYMTQLRDAIDPDVDDV